MRFAPARWYFAGSAGPGATPNPPLRRAAWYFADTGHSPEHGGPGSLGR